MDNVNKIVEQFHYFNIKSEIDSEYGNWAVSTDGDVVNSVYPYAIFAIHINETDWLEKIRAMVWYKPEYGICLKKALDRAKIIVKDKK